MTAPSRNSQSPKTDRLYLVEIVELADEIAESISTLDEESLVNNDMLRSGTQFKLMMIGEMSSRVSMELRERYADVSWGHAADLREYRPYGRFDRDWTRAWQHATFTVPALSARVSAILQSDFPSSKQDEEVSSRKSSTSADRHGIKIDMDALAEICKRYHVRELSLFGSVLRDDFREDSDVDILVEFEPGAPIGLFEFSDLKYALADLLGRDVDLVEKPGLKAVIREDVLSSAEVLFAD